ncbi:MAG: DUF4162 domain-containing protein, partial [Candidatus Lokiarchaeota archaeon]
TIINKGKVVLSDKIENVKRLFKGDIYILNTDRNKAILQKLTNLDFVLKTWIDENDNKIHIITSDLELAKKAIPKLVIENDGVLQEFSQPELSLQEIFMKIIEEGGISEK